MWKKYKADDAIQRFFINDLLLFVTRSRKNPTWEVHHIQEETARDHMAPVPGRSESLRLIYH